MVTGPLARPPQLPGGTVPGLSAPSPNGNLASLFPLVTPAPAAPGAGQAQKGRAQLGPLGTGGGRHRALTADTGVIGTGQGRLIVLAVTLAAGIAAFGFWFTVAGPARRVAGPVWRVAGPVWRVAGPARRMASSLARWRGDRTR